MKKSVIIIGGGIAGLAAARELAREGLAVTVLEAKDRCGGRIHTFRERDLPIELGAEFVHGTNPALLKLLREAKLPTLEMPGGEVCIEGGQQHEVDTWKIVMETFRQVDKRAEDCSCEEFLVKKHIPEPERTYARNFVEGFHAADPRRISVHALCDWLENSELEEGLQNEWIATGYGSLVDFYEKEIGLMGGEIKKYMNVGKITWKRGSAEVWAKENFEGNPPSEHPEFLSVPPPKMQPMESPQKFAAEAVIITVPLGILKRDQIKFEPEVPEKMEAIRKMSIGNVMKMIFVFRQPIGDTSGLIEAPDEPIPVWWNRIGQAVLVGWAGGPKADSLLKRFPQELEEVGLESLCKIFPNHATAIRQNFVKSYYWNWADDPNIRGAYSYIPVGEIDLPERLAMPIANTLFFAGEATSPPAQGGTVHGALETGLRAAREVLSVV